MNNFQNSKIYKIVDNTNGNIYVGSTTKTIEKRLKKHKKDYKSYLNGKYSFVTSFKILENDDYQIELIEDFPCDDKKQLFEREGYWIKNNNCVNKIIVGRTDKQYYEDNKDKIKEYNKKYHDDNKDKIKQYREDNKDKIKQYCEDNKDKIKEHKNKKCICECGSYYTNCNKSHHEKSKKHQEYKNKIILNINVPPNVNLEININTINDKVEHI